MNNDLWFKNYIAISRRLLFIEGRSAVEFWVSDLDIPKIDEIHEKLTGVVPKEQDKLRFVFGIPVYGKSCVDQGTVTAVYKIEDCKYKYKTEKFF